MKKSKKFKPVRIPLKILRPAIMKWMLEGIQKTLPIIKKSRKVQ